MKFTNTIIIDRPIEEVFNLFQDPKYLGEYQDGFIKKELISGIEGEAGSVSRMYYEKDMVITETILVSNFPEEFAGNYHHKHMDNVMKCSFVKISNKRTEYISEVEYTAFRGIMPRLFAFLFPSMFKKQVKKWMDNFKAFAEGK